MSELMNYGEKLQVLLNKELQINKELTLVYIYMHNQWTQKIVR